MDSKGYEILGYQILKIEMNFEDVKDGDHEIQLKTSLNILVPEQKTDPECLVIIQTAFSDEREENILSVTIRAKVRVENRDENTTEYLRDEVVPDVYGYLKKFIEQLLSQAHIEFLPMPLYEDLISKNQD